MKWISLLVLASTACSAAAQKPVGDVNSFSAPGAMFGSYRSFSFGLAEQPKPGYDVTARSLEVQRRMQPLVLEALRERGYTNEAEHADLIVKISAGTGTATEQVGNVSGDPYGSWSENAPPNVAEGFIGINIYDAAKGTQLWQGTAFAEINLEHIDEALLKRGIARMLSTLPRREPQRISAR